MAKLGDQNKQPSDKSCCMTEEGQQKLQDTIRSRGRKYIKGEGNLNYSAISEQGQMDASTAKKIVATKGIVTRSSIVRLGSSFGLNLEEDIDFKCVDSDKLFRSSFDRNSIAPEFENINLEIATNKTEYLEDTTDDFMINKFNNANPQSIIQEEINRKLDLYANVAREKLYGVDVYLSKLKEYLNNENDWLIGVVGQGGVGKTSVVEKLVREHGAKLGFTDFAWVTAKRTFLRMENLSKEKIGNSSINLASVITSIANQLQITLPTDPNVDNLFKYLWTQLKKDSYLIVIDNLETLDEGEQLIQGFNPYGSLPSSKIILTSRGKLQQNNNRIREVSLKGIDLQSTLALIRYKGDHVERIVTATDEELLPIREISEGIPLIILLVVNLIATNPQLSLEQIIDKVKKEKNIFSYLYDKSLDSISPEALHVLDIMVEFCSNSSIYHDRLKQFSNLNDNDFNNSISELIRSSLLQNVSKLTDQSRYSIHSLLYEFLENDILNQEI